MKVLVIGSGGREHAICSKLSESTTVNELFAAPGNPGMAEVAENVSIAVDDSQALLKFITEESIDLVVVGPEYPLSLGVADEIRKIGVHVFGPSKAAAQLESSKAFAKEIMAAANVPTAGYEAFTDQEAAAVYLSSANYPLVIKADGLAAGKGVFICNNNEEANSALKQAFADLKSTKVLVEDFLDGIEASFIVATDGETIIPFATSHDYKRLSDNDMGPNTGGMGTVSPSPRVSMELEKQVLEKVIEPVLVEMKSRGIPFNGFLYAGLMLLPNGDISVLEFNVRMGDPECQAILSRFQSDFAELLWALAANEGYSKPLEWSEGSSVCVVMSSEGYPQKPVKGDTIQGISEANSIGNIQVFHAGTNLESDGELITGGGRVLNVIGSGESLEAARKAAYEGVAMISFRGAHFRKDIGIS